METNKNVELQCQLRNLKADKKKVWDDASRRHFSQCKNPTTEYSCCDIWLWSCGKMEKTIEELERKIRKNTPESRSDDELQNEICELEKEKNEIWGDAARRRICCDEWVRECAKREEKIEELERVLKGN